MHGVGILLHRDINWIKPHIKYNWSMHTWNLIKGTSSECGANISTSEAYDKATSLIETKCEVINTLHHIININFQLMEYSKYPRGLKILLQVINYFRSTSDLRDSPTSHIERGAYCSYSVSLTSPKWQASIICPTSTKEERFLHNDLYKNKSTFPEKGN